MSGKKYINLSVVAVNRSECDGKFLFTVSLDNGDVLEFTAKSSGVHEVDIELVKGICEGDLWEDVKDIILSVVDMDQTLGAFLFVDVIEGLKISKTRS